jgi:hypothetical protein
MAKYYRRLNHQGEPFFIDESGKEVSESTARKNLVQEGKAHAFRESADSAAARTLLGHFVQDKNQYGPDGLYEVAAVNDNGSATLHGPIGKGGTRTVSHSALVKNHTDLGAVDQLSAVCESEKSRAAMEEAFDRGAPNAKDKQKSRATEQDIDKGAKPNDARAKMEDAFRRPIDRIRESLRPTNSQD